MSGGGHPRLSSLTCDRLTYMVQEVRDGSATHEALSALLAVAGVVDEDGDRAVEDKLNRLVTDLAPATVDRLFAALPDLASRPVAPALADAALGHGVQPLALAAIAEACDVSACMDIGPVDMPGPQIGVTRKDDEDEVMVPLGADVYATRTMLFVRTGVLPDTLVAAAPGRPVRDVVDHPLIERAAIVIGQVAGGDSGFHMFETSGGAVATWTEWAARSVDRSHARRARAA